MAAAQQDHPIIDRPATPQQCAADYRPPAQAAQAAADARTQLGAISGQQHTHRS
jgi:hypothetical protein